MMRNANLFRLGTMKTGRGLSVTAWTLAVFLLMGVAPCLAGATKTIHEAAATGDDDALYELIRNNPSSVNKKDESGDTPLHLAAKHLQADAVLRLLNAAADYDVKDKNGFTPLHLAIIEGEQDKDSIERRVNVVMRLLMEGASYAVKGPSGHTPMQLAAIHGRVGAMNVLLRAGASVNVADKAGRMPIHFAARFGRVGALNWLVKHKVGVSVRDKVGLTPLHYAARGWQKDAVKRLFALGASASAVSDNGRTPLHELADAESLRPGPEQRAVETAELLIKHGVDFGAKDKSGKTASELAAAHGLDRLAKRLRH